MKFLTKINRQYIWTLSILLIIVSVVGFFVLKSIVLNEIKEDIFEKEYAIINEIKTQKNTPNIYPIIETKKITEADIEDKSYKNISLLDKAENEEEPYLEYTNTVKIDNQYYLIKLRHSLLESDDLIMAISLPLLLLLVLSLSVLFFTTKRMNKTIWKDFESNLKTTENFSFEKQQTINLKQTNIDEFNRLNETITELTQKLQNDYQSLKEFTENASHEIQTPISIISLNLEEILQQNLSEPVFKQIIATQNAVKRLSTAYLKLLFPHVESIDDIEMDEFKLFNRTLSATDINTTYNNELAGIDYNGTARTCPVCTSAPMVPASWELIGIPADLRTAASKDVSTIFDEFNATTYDSIGSPTDWIVYQLDYNTSVSNGTYSFVPYVGAPLQFGKGYWIWSAAAVAWSENGLPGVDYNSTNPACVFTSCVELDLVTPGLSGVTLNNMLSFIGNVPVDWADCRIIISDINGSTAYTPSAAETAGFIEKQIWQYNPGAIGVNSNGYTTCDDTTPGGCKLEPYKGFWIRLKDTTMNKTVKLLLPKE